MKSFLNKDIMAPLYGAKKNLVYDNKVLSPKSVGLPNSRALIWQQFDYNNKNNRDTRPLVMTQEDGELQSLDPIRSIAPSVLWYRYEYVYSTANIKMTMIKLQRMVP
ncbi:RGD-containing lipoprotein [Staphylococcus gallinarum]|uniref:RGD-containing lipoprotein n=1 Tax=Staphylococcus gallinarum TaxID=1293 RepID=A0A380F8V9_STAGA|nr:RGD-containing lipoprotein [Staphylococcus gallinarum]